jgi:peptidoglycan/LPS O-acetylase OafA/YrhL
MLEERVVFDTMFGIWRTLLAIEVVAFHLLFLPFIGAYAVFSFFVLSGFLMTHIVHSTYGYSPGGLARYLGNRALRLYPSYWFALCLSIALIWVVGAPLVAAYHPAITMPATTTAWIENLTMIFPAVVPRDVMPRLIPLTWALTVEIVYYVLIGLGLSRTRTITALWLAASIAYAIVARSLHHPKDSVDEIIPIFQYSAVAAGSLPFALGALVWHYRQGLCGWLERFHIGNPCLLIVMRWALYIIVAVIQARLGWKGLVMIGNWLNVGLSGLIVCTLFHFRPAPRWRAIDRAVGDYSYPIYLLHMQMGLLAAVLLFGSPVTGRSLNSLAVFGLGLFLTCLAGTVCARLIDPAAEKLRSRIKQWPAVPTPGQ